MRFILEPLLKILPQKIGDKLFIWYARRTNKVAGYLSVSAYRLLPTDTKTHLWGLSRTTFRRIPTDVQATEWLYDGDPNNILAVKEYAHSVLDILGVPKQDQQRVVYYNISFTTEKPVRIAAPPHHEAIGYHALQTFIDWQRLRYGEWVVYDKSLNRLWSVESDCFYQLYAPVT